MVRRTSSRVSLLALLVALVLVMLPAAAAANSGPPTRAGDRSGVLVPGRSSQIHVLREALRFDLSEDIGRATVTARYEMENRGEALKEYAVIFVWQAHSGGSDVAPTVSWNGQAVPWQVLDLSPLSGAEREQMHAAWTAMEKVADPLTGELVDWHSWEGNLEAVTYLGFNLDLPANSTGVLEVTYQHIAAMDYKGYIDTMYAYQYLLLPAKSWASFGPLEIEVTGAGPDQIFFGSNLPLKWDGEAYRASLPGLPDQNLAFSVLSRAGAIGSWGRPGPYYWLSFVVFLIAAALLGVGLGWLCGWIPQRGWAITVALAVGFFGGGLLAFLLSMGIMAIFPPLRNQSYGSVFIAAGQTLIGTPLMMTLAGICTSRWSRRRYRALAPTGDV
ncbi:MAG: hypothetical protein K0R39_3032 [Symbiobacteriaceae bacterium]|nr:hypothetical protein [Symbiobacteriaceae bacterium]